MKSWRVVYREVILHDFVVEAETAEDAKEQVRERIEESGDDKPTTSDSVDYAWAHTEEGEGAGATVTCCHCEEQVPATTAHLHQGLWIGDECCWDERLRSSE